MNSIVTILVVFTVFFMVSGCLTYLFARLGVHVHPQDYLAMHYTFSYAFFVSLGLLGVLFFYQSASLYNDNKLKGWLQMIGGFALIIVSWLSLNSLLYQCYGR